MVVKSQIADITALPVRFNIHGAYYWDWHIPLQSTLNEKIMPKARPTAFGWAGTRFDWKWSAAAILAEDAAADVAAFGWAGSRFDWNYSAAAILAEDAAADGVAFGWAGTRFDWKRSAAAILAEDASD